MIIEFSENWSAEIEKRAEERGVSPQNLILNALNVDHFLRQELEGGKALAIVSPEGKICQEIILPGENPKIPSLTAKFIIAPTLPVGSK